MATIAVFGASGRTGLPFIQQALEAGYTVQALVRTPQKITISHPRLRLIKGDALNPADIDKVIYSSDGVVSLLGQDKASQPDLQTRATKLIIESLKKHKLRRLISLTGGGVRDAAHDKPGFMDNLIVFIMKNVAGSGARNALTDGISHAELIRQSGLDWTIVRGPMLTEDTAKGSYQVGYVGTVKGIKLTRADLASFILTEWETSQWVGKFPFVTNG
ncbi:NAD(P)-dependent oxidoreductase [Fibrella aquatilis]|uniref:NAD(P)H-binding protein n=1 Tax=Fibrella aquatilis TaxID=2817059 RepID=A0A939K2A9_9BACT|nr:NAD(P)H-binding protein [Fibrella aquatilis]MBO0933115.1 NAD(P)H-binding protein [Fibrella aquatilis]